MTRCESCLLHVVFLFVLGWVNREYFYSTGLGYVGSVASVDVSGMGSKPGGAEVKDVQVPRMNDSA